MKEEFKETMIEKNFDENYSAHAGQAALWQQAVKPEGMPV